MDTIWNTVTKLYGEHGASQTNVTLVEHDPETKLIVVRTAQPATDMFRASMATVTRIAGKPAAVHLISISGTVKALHKRLGRTLG